MNLWGRCASYYLKDYQKQLNYVFIKSPVEVDVVFHSKEQSSIPIELSTRLRFDGDHTVQVSVEKTIDVDQEKKPCYDPEKHQGETYGDYDYKRLNNKFLEQFNCTTPFIPPQFRNGGEICLNQTIAKKIHILLRQSSASLTANMWKEDYHSIPPCVYHTYNIQHLRSDGKVEKEIPKAKLLFQENQEKYTLMRTAK